jgi:hypothetical protein
MFQFFSHADQFFISPPISNESPFYSYLFHQSNVLRNLKALLESFLFGKNCEDDEIKEETRKKRWNQHNKKAFSQRRRIKDAS